MCQSDQGFMFQLSSESLVMARTNRTLSPSPSAQPPFLGEDHTPSGVISFSEILFTSFNWDQIPQKVFIIAGKGDLSNFCLWRAYF
mmetsp:Transcript_40133/g.45870  ORF Transcript_40133/g.45870 Transcript_40133/m.45870 type:complete len:86 (+) Transcript_40133:119-376(+)